MKASLSRLHSYRLQRCFFVALLTLFFAALCAALPVRAAKDAQENPAEAPIGLLFRWLNFALVFGGGGYLIARRAPAFFRRRAEIVASGLHEAAAVKSEAERQLREAEEKLQRLDAEVPDLRAAAEREAAAEAERLRAATMAEAEKIARAAEAEIEAAQRAARAQLKALAAQWAVERAQALLRERLTQAVQASLLHAFVDRLARSAH